MTEKKPKIRKTVLSALEGRATRMYLKVTLRGLDFITRKNNATKCQKSPINTLKLKIAEFFTKSSHSQPANNSEYFTHSRKIIQDQANTH